DLACQIIWYIGWRRVRTEVQVEPDLRQHSLRLQNMALEFQFADGPRPEVDTAFTQVVVQTCDGQDSEFRRVTRPLHHARQQIGQRPYRASFISGGDGRREIVITHGNHWRLRTAKAACQ